MFTPSLLTPSQTSTFKTPPTSTIPSTDQPTSTYTTARPRIQSSADLFAALSQYKEISRMIVGFWEGEPKFLLLVEETLDTIESIMHRCRKDNDFILADTGRSSARIPAEAEKAIVDTFTRVLGTLDLASSGFYVHQVLIFVSKALSIVDTNFSDDGVDGPQDKLLIRLLREDIPTALKPFFPTLRLLSCARYSVIPASSMDKAEEALDYWGSHNTWSDINECYIENAFGGYHIGEIWYWNQQTCKHEPFWYLPWEICHNDWSTEEEEKEKRISLGDLRRGSTTYDGQANTTAGHPLFYDWENRSYEKESTHGYCWMT